MSYKSKASGSQVTTGTNDENPITPKALADAGMATGGYPQRADIRHITCKAIAGSTFTIDYGRNDVALDLSSYGVTLADGHGCMNSFMLKAGTYNFNMIGYRYPNGGKVDVFVDDVLIGNVDTYSASTTFAYKYNISSVTITGSGRHTIKFICNGKNASAGAYNIVLSSSWFEPTTADTAEIPTGGALNLTLNYSTNALTSNVTITDAVSFFDGPSVSLTAGTYLVTGQVYVEQATYPTVWYVKLWDGTNVIASTEQPLTNYSANYSQGTISLSGIIVLSGTATVKFSVKSNNGGSGSFIKANAGFGNNASVISAVRIA